MKTETKALIIVALLLSGCGPSIEQEVSFLGEQGYCLETTAWDYWPRLELVSYQLVYTGKTYEDFESGHCLIWFTKSEMNDSIKSAQWQYAKDALNRHQNAMK